MLQHIIIAFLSAVLIENFVLVRFLGICPFLGVSRKTDTAWGMGIAVIFVMAVASAISSSESPLPHRRKAESVEHAHRFAQAIGGARMAIGPERAVEQRLDLSGGDLVQGKQLDQARSFR